MAGLPAWMVEPDPAAGGALADMRLVAKRELSDGVVALDLSPVDGSAVPSWEPGAHVDLHLPGGAIRQYSICGKAEERGLLRVAVMREAGGRGGSRFLHDRAAVGDILPVSSPRNNFALASARRYLFIAGGIGITPIVPMIARAESDGADWRLFYGGRSRRSMAFLEELEEDSRVELVPEDENGRLDVAAILSEPRADVQVYCCGPEPLLRAVEGAGARWRGDALHFERFKPREDVPRGLGTAFTVVLERSGVELRIEPGRSILETVAAAGVPVPSSCEEGTCGTCETLVLEGEPEHRDSILSPADRAANDCMMICVSRARGERLVIDL